VPTSAALHWVRAPGAERCVDGQTLARRVEDRAGRAVFTSASAADRTIEGLVAPARQGWSVTVRVYAGGALLGGRVLTFDAPDCAALTDAVTLVVALAIDPEGCVNGRCASPAPTSPALTPPAPALPRPMPPTSPEPPPVVGRPPMSLLAEAPPSSRATPSRATGVWAAHGTVGVAAAGLLASPVPALGVELGWSAPVAPVTLALSLAGWVPVRSNLDLRPGASVLQGGAAVTVSACLAPVSRVSAFVCGGVLAAALYASGEGLDATEETIRPGVALALRCGVHVRVGAHLSIRVIPSLLVPLAWPSYVLVVSRSVDGSFGDRPVASPGVLGGGVDLAVGWSFGS
jgi:hypothetical protein